MPHTPFNYEADRQTQIEQQRVLAEVFKSLAAGGIGEYQDAS